VRAEEPSSQVSSTVAVVDVTCSDESEADSTFTSTFALPRFRFVVVAGSGVSSGVRSPVPLTSAPFSVPYPAKDLRSEVNRICYGL